MKKLKLAKYPIVITLVFAWLYSCTMEPRSTIAIVKNNKTFPITIGTESYQNMPDNYLYDGTFGVNFIDPDSSQRIILPLGGLSYRPDSFKFNMFIFNSDSIDKYRSLKQVEGIVKASLIKKISIQLNKVKEPLDTIYVK